MRVLVAILFLPVLAIAHAVEPGPLSKIHTYITSYSNVAGSNAVSYASVDDLLHRLESRREHFKNEKYFLGHIFTKTHQRFLKDYQEYATFNQLLKDGKYNCLTGTALYALILDHFGFQYEIIETNYHIFVVAETVDGKVLFESTDPLEGFVDNDADIKKRVATYKQNIPVQSNTNKTYYRFNVGLYNPIDLNEILGLLYYNHAVNAYNKGDLPSSVANLEKAMQLYQSPRTEEFSKIVLLTILESKLDNSLKESFMRQIQAMRSLKMPVVASANLYKRESED